MNAGLESRIAELWIQGGVVMTPLALCALTLWFALGYRWAVLHSGDRRGARGVLAPNAAKGRGVLSQAAAQGRALLEAHPHNPRATLKLALADSRAEIARFTHVIVSVVAVAPLLGLLGTVTGMIETFDSLGENVLLSRAGGGVAGGIAEALFSTQVGLMVAIPGLVMGRLLERRQSRLADELDKLEGLLLERASETA